MGKPGMGSPPVGWRKMQAGYINGLLQVGTVPAMLLLPTGKAKEKKGVRLIKILCLFCFWKSRAKIVFMEQMLAWTRNIKWKRESKLLKTFCQLCFLRKQDEKNFHGRRFWCGREILREKRNPSHKISLPTFFLKKAGRKKFSWEQVLVWKGNIKWKRESKA